VVVKKPGMEGCRVKCCRKRESSDLTLLQMEPLRLLKQESDCVTTAVSFNPGFLSGIFLSIRSADVEQFVSIPVAQVCPAFPGGCRQDLFSFEVIIYEIKYICLL